jgi:hypothetical protein
VVIKVGSPTRAREAGSSSYNSPKAAEKLLQCISDGNEVGPRSESAETSLQYHLAKSLVVKLLGARYFSRKHSEAATPWVDIKTARFDQHSWKKEELVALRQRGHRSRALTLSIDPELPAGSLCICRQARPSYTVPDPSLHGLPVPRPFFAAVRL